MNLLIVMHFKDEFLETSHDVYDYFRRVLKLPESQIYFYSQETWTRGVSLIDRVNELIAKNTPLVIYYGGHGLRNGWQLSSSVEVPYKTLVSTLRKQKKPLVILNDCCYGMALQPHLRELQCDHLLLGLSPKNKEGYDDQGFVKSITKCWKKHRLADPKLWVLKKEKLSRFVLEKCGGRLRYGAALDHLCYPKSRRR